MYRLIIWSLLVVSTAATAQNKEYAEIVERIYGVPSELTLAIHECEKKAGTIEKNNCFGITDLYGEKQAYKTELDSYLHFGLVVSRSHTFEPLRQIPAKELETLVKTYYFTLDKKKQ